MELIIYLVAFVLLLFLYHVYSIQFSARKLPPGPFVTPFGLGILPAIIFNKPKLILEIFNLKPWVFMDNLSKKYGPFYSVDIGPFYALVISSYEILMEVANMEEYNMKFSHPDLTYPRTFNKELGLAFASREELWVEMRRFTQRTLRDFGFGKRHTMQSAIDAETSALIKDFNGIIRNNNGIMKVRTKFVLSLLNTLWCMVAGQRYEHDDPILTKMMDRNFAMTKSTTFGEPLNLIFSRLKKIWPSLFKEDLRLQVYKECHDFTKVLVDERKAEGLYKNDPQNYIDVFLQKIEENKDNDKSVYTEENLQAMLADLLQTGTTTTNGTLNYGLLFLTLNPAVQKKCQAEIDSIVPRHLTPTLENIEKMPYFQAFILETHRLGNIVPNPIPRIVPKDWHIRGYTIPKGSVIVSNHYSVHMDKEYWGDPEVFRPERFIDEKGEFKLDKRVCHFGFGKRGCIGITLANSVIPIFFGTLLQNFNFSVVPGQEPPTIEPEIGVSLSPMEYEVKITNRAPVEQSRQG